MLHGHPITAILPGDFNIGERFWYWYGASGRSYIHSIYPVDDCPPLPGASFIAASRAGNRRYAVALGRLPRSLEVAAGDIVRTASCRTKVDEVHVHLLARGEALIEAVASDLRRSFDELTAGRACAIGSGEAATRLLVGT